MKTNKARFISTLPGARKLLDENQQPYALPLVALTPTLEKKVSEPKDAKSWCDFWAKHKEEMSIEHQIGYLQQAIITDPEYAPAWYSLACVYELQGEDWYAATHSWNQVIYLAPNNETAWFSLAQLWAHRGVMSKARECQAEYERLSGKTPETKPKEWWEFWK